MNVTKTSSKGAGSNRRLRKQHGKLGRTSRQLCQEKLACHSQQLAKYRCEECGTLQCEPCENLLHENNKFLFHGRAVLTPVPPSLLCQTNCLHVNFADVHCVNCNKNLCFDCEEAHHSSSRKSHQRVPFELPTPDTFDGCKDLDEFYSADWSSSRDEYKEFEYHSISSDCNDFLSSEVVHSTLLVNELETARSSMEQPAKMKSKKQDKKGEILSKSFVLIDDKETLKIQDEEEFIEKLQCSASAPMKVVSIFGNTGEGKSYTLNHTFYEGREVFRTSQAQASCTIGVWAAYNPSLNIITLDTEGLLGFTTNANQRIRLLLKVLAISDIIIYRTRAERLHNDLFHFLGDASRAYSKHFTRELRAASKRCNIEGPLSILGPTVIIFHETLHTEILIKGSTSNSPEEILKYRFKELGYAIDAFSALEYVGTQTPKPPTEFSMLLSAVKKHLNNLTVRSARKPSVVFQALRVFNEKFSGDIEKTILNVFPDQYFTCTSRCLSCMSRCRISMNHLQDGLLHECEAKCVYQHQFDNRIFTCKSCYERGKEVIVVPKTSSSSDSSWIGLAKYAWSGYVLECKYCGVIHRSREYWYGNRDPVETVVRTEIRHVWHGGNTVLQGTHNAAQKVIDGVKDISSAVSHVSAKPTKMLTSWMADKIAPSYWIPNSELLRCGKCQKIFLDTESKHHCRACGGGFCEDCSSKAKPVPERGWGSEPVRVCDICYSLTNNEERVTESEVTARKVGEVIQKTLGSVKEVIDLPIEFIKDSARPVYWVSNHEIKDCFVCKSQFPTKCDIHHCRACGQGVCDQCSMSRRPVSSRGWDQEVRVCDKCNEKSDL